MPLNAKPPALRCMTSDYARHGLRRGGRVEDWMFISRVTFKHVSDEDMILIACKAGQPAILSAKLGHFRFIL